MTVSERAGQPAEASMLVDVDKLVKAYYEERPDPSDAGQQVAFGTSGHRGSALKGSFNEAHILATTEAICRYRGRQGIDGPLFLGRDTHALSEPAQRTALEVLVANGVDVRVDALDRPTPTPALSHAILGWNRGRGDTDITGWVQDEANRLLRAGLDGVRRVSADRPAAAHGVQPYDYVDAYVGDLAAIVDTDAIRGAGLRLGVDPLGGAAVDYWNAIADRYGFDLEVVNQAVDPTFGFMSVDWDGKIRMDPSSRYAMASLIGLRDRFDVAFANDADADRHGIVTGGAGLLNPNHYLAAMVAYLFGGGREWGSEVGVGKTMVSSSMIDRVVADLGRRLDEVPVGFKWFVDGLLDGTLGFGGEESAGASFLRRDGTVWTTDKDGIVCCLLAAEMTARRGADPGAQYRELTARFGESVYTRTEAPATAEEKEILRKLSAQQVRLKDLAGEQIQNILTHAPGNGAPIGGLKVVAESGWFAARPSGTENIYKIYVESFRGTEHLQRILDEAQTIVSDAVA